MNQIASYVGQALKSFTGSRPKVTSRLVSLASNEVDLYQELGSGRYGIVRMGKLRNGKIKQNIAVKVVPKYRATISELKNEIDCLSKVRGHKNVMNLIDAFEDNTHVYVLTPLYSGGELFDRIVTQRIFTEVDARRNMYQLLSAIAHCHSKSIVHRDVKPENLLYSSQDPEAELVLVDFGMSREFHPETDKPMNLQCGSPSYVAPEVLLKTYDEKCDLWSCGVILHILLVGKTPFGDGTEDEILERVECFAKLDMSGPEWSKISNEAKDLLLRLLTLEPQNRCTPQQALNHSWMLMDEKAVEEKGGFLFGAQQNMKEFNRHRRLKRAAIRVIAELARDEESAQRFSQYLSKLKRDEHGRVKLSDLANIMPNQEKFAFEGLRVYDAGMVDPKELIASALAKSIYLDEHYLLAAFKKFDISGDGFLDKHELALALGKDPKLDKELVNEAFLHADKDGSGKISFEEFADVIREGSTHLLKKRELTIKA